MDKVDRLKKILTDIDREVKYLRTLIDPGAPATQDADLNGYSAINLGSVVFLGGESIDWNDKYHAIQVPTGDGSIAKLGIDTLFDIHNNTGTTLLKGEVIYPLGSSTNGRSNVGRAIANSHETISGPIGIVAADILDGNDGHVMIQGILDPIDTSGLSEGIVYLSDVVPGGLTNIRPTFSSYEVQLGVVDNVDVNGVLSVDANHDIQDILTHAWDGAFVENFDFLVSSDGATITGTLERSGGGNLTRLTSDGFITLDCTPALSITLTPGLDSAPQLNYIYLNHSTGLLEVSTAGWPIAEHSKIADVILQSAAKVQSDDILGNRNWNDHVKIVGDNGHLLHVTERLRQFPATWNSGTQATCTVDSPTASNVYIAVTGGTVYQLHRHDFPAIDMQAGAKVYIVNNSVSAFTDVTNLNTQTLDATGTTLANKSFSFVLWGVQNKTGEPSPIMINLPTGSYARTSPDQAINDADNHSVYDIPDNFKGKGFLIARFTFQLASNGTDWTLYDTEDLRGKLPNSTAGGGGAGGAGATDWVALLDTPNSYASQSLKHVRVNAGETGLEFIDGVTKVGTPLNDQVCVWTGDGTLEGDVGFQFDVVGYHLKIGRNDFGSSHLSMYGNGSNLGGRIDIYTGGQYDDDVDFYIIRSINDEFRLEAGNDNFLKYTAATSQLAFPMYGGGTITGTPTQGLAVDVSGNVIETALATGDVTKVGTPVNTQLAVWTGDGTLEGKENIRIGTTNIDIGTQGVWRGYMNLYGGGTTQVPYLNFYNPNSYITDDNYYQISMLASKFTLRGNNTGYFLSYDPATQKLDLPKPLILSSYGGGTIIGTPTYGLSVDVSGNLIETALATGDVTKDGTTFSNQVGVWTGDGTLGNGAGYLKMNGSTLEVGLNGGVQGWLDLYGGGATGSQIRMYKSNNGDTNDDQIIFGGVGDVFEMKGNATGDFLTYTSATQVVDIPKPTKISAGYTVATLPTGAVGQRAYVTDATSPTYLGTLTGGGAVTCPVFHNGTEWVSC
jgi:hypothetical protein